jgi:hypothetical protein
MIMIVKDTLCFYKLLILLSSALPFAARIIAGNGLNHRFCKRLDAGCWIGKEDYASLPTIIALISFKTSLMEGMFDGLILSGVCL